MPQAGDGEGHGEPKQAELQQILLSKFQLPQLVMKEQKQGKNPDSSTGKERNALQVTIATYSTQQANKTAPGHTESVILRDDASRANSVLPYTAQGTCPESEGSDPPGTSSPQPGSSATHCH